MTPREADKNIDVVAQLVRGSLRGRPRPRRVQFSLGSMFVLVSVACVALAVSRSVKPGPIGWQAYGAFQTPQGLWGTCGVAAFVLAVLLAVGVYRLGPDKGLLAFWLLSLVSTMLFAVAMSSSTTTLSLLQAGHGAWGAIRGVSTRNVVLVFCHFPLFFVLPATGLAWYMSKVYSE